ADARNRCDAGTAATGGRCDGCADRRNGCRARSRAGGATCGRGRERARNNDVRVVRPVRVDESDLVAGRRRQPGGDARPYLLAGRRPRRLPAGRRRRSVRRVLPRLDLRGRRIGERGRIYDVIKPPPLVEQQQHGLPQRAQCSQRRGRLRNLLVERLDLLNIPQRSVRRPDRLKVH
ncbi:MAG: hypothetical protein ACK5QX_11130, partial [bacterium]